jgi:hypothetical protein
VSPGGGGVSAPDFFPSPKKSFQLLVYIEPLAVAFVAQHIVDPNP